MSSYYIEDEERAIIDEFCPACHEEYDEVDYEYQICHHCGCENNKTPNNNELKN